MVDNLFCFLVGACPLPVITTVFLGSGAVLTFWVALQAYWSGESQSYGDRVAQAFSVTLMEGLIKSNSSCKRGDSSLVEQ